MIWHQYIPGHYRCYVYYGDARWSSYSYWLVPGAGELS